MPSNEISLVELYDAIVSGVPDRDLVVWESTRRTYAEAAERTRAVASSLVARGLGAHRERAELERWERGQDAVALVLRNCPEYLEAMLASFRARTVPFNVNHHYKAGEMAGLFTMIGPRAVVYHRSYGPVVAEALGGRDAVLIHVEDDSEVPVLEGSVSFDEAAAHPIGELPTTSADDLYMVCTGGTTGMPKAVLWRQADIIISGMGGDQTATAEATAAAAVGNEISWFAAPPLMHAAAQWTAWGGIRQGATIVLHDELRSDARRILEAAERERVSLMSIVGDAYARPIVEELRTGRYDLSGLGVLATGGAATNEIYKEALLDMLPQVIIVDGYGASETGGMAFGARSRATTPVGFAPAAGATVLSADRSRFLEPGEDEVGWTARGGRVPLGYLDDRERTETTFPMIDGQRYSVPGDRARLAEDGSIIMLGRDAMVINTGGEKVFVEEVEDVLRRHDDVVDALVVGRPSDRFGQEVAAVVQLRDGAAVSPHEIREFVAASLARYKAPHAVAFCDTVARLPNGKPDYAWARTLVATAPDATAPAQAAHGTA